MLHNLHVLSPSKAMLSSADMRTSLEGLSVFLAGDSVEILSEISVKEEPPLGPSIW